MKPARTRQEVEADLLENVHRAREHFLAAIDGNRDAAREQFRSALQVFNELVIDGKRPPEP